MANAGGCKATQSYVAWDAMRKRGVISHVSEIYDTKNTCLKGVLSKKAWGATLTVWRIELIDHGI